MISTEHKSNTLRKAKASASLRMNAEAFQILKSNAVPKGNALEAARIAAMMAAKRTSEIIPHCHPMPLDQVLVDYSFGDGEIVVTISVTAIWKTGVEMEALIAAQTAAATIFDMLKMFDPAMMITDVRVIEKTGGKSDYQETLPANFKAAVVVTSDGTFAGTRQDRSGQIIKERLSAFGIHNIEYTVLPDDFAEIKSALGDFCDNAFDLVVTTGGTGLGPRDVTALATREVIDQEIPGIMEAARSFGQQRTPYAMLSKGVTGLKGKTLIVNLPGSSKGTSESLDAIFPAVLHGYKMMEGGGH